LYDGLWFINTPPPTEGAEYCDEHVCLSVCPHAYIRTARPTSPKVSFMLAVASSSCGGVAIRYVLPVLWMTSCFHIKNRMAACRYRSSVTARSMPRVIYCVLSQTTAGTKTRRATRPRGAENRVTIGLLLLFVC